MSVISKGNTPCRLWRSHPQYFEQRGYGALKRGMPLRHCGPKERGTILLGVMVLALVATLLSIAVFNNGKAVNDKVQAVNAADAAAYSSAVWAARNLNFMAYTNRAIYLNHAVIGHLVSYMAWLRFYGRLSNGASMVTGYIPLVGQYIVQLNSLIQQGVTATETVSAPFMVESVTLLNNLYFTTQNLSRLNGVVTLKQIMDQTAAAHHPDIRVNHPEDLTRLVADLAKIDDFADLVNVQHTDLKDLGQCMKMYWDYYAFTSSFTPTRDIEFNRRKRSMLMTEKTIFGMRVDDYTTSFGLPQKNWYTNRDWDFSLLGIDILRKKGATQLVYGEGRVDWIASDYLDKISNLGIFGKWKRLFSGVASASEFSLGRNYKGFPGYQELSREKQSDQKLRFTALTSVPFSPLTAMSAVHSSDHSADPSERIMAMATAEVFYRRPLRNRHFSRGFRKSPKTEYPNLFNPFWQARLI